MKILDRYIDQLIEQSTPESPVWNIEKIREVQIPPGTILTAA